jgi:hypothetical protein
MSDEARWTPDQQTSEVRFGRGRAPRMTYMPWWRSQATELGMTDEGTYRRCPRQGCRIWAGPYRNTNEAKQDGMDHDHLAH